MGLNLPGALTLGAAARAVLLAPDTAPPPDEAPRACGRFDRCIDGLNRLPRPLLTLAVLGLFAHAMAEPAGFALRMRALAEMPEPLWWLIGAVVTFYFGARETHYRRTRAGPPAGDNPALAEWRGDRDPATGDSSAHGLSAPRRPIMGHEPGS